MATSAPPLSILPVSGGYAMQYAIGQFYTDSTTATKIHIKTNIPKGTTGSQGYMVLVEAVGFNYGVSQAVRASWCFYEWQGTIYSKGVQNVYPGMTPEEIYYSSDNYVCLRASLPGTYYLGFVLNGYCANGDGAGLPIGITTIVANTVTGNHF